jgi:hypothetical protein
MIAERNFEIRLNSSYAQDGIKPFPSKK